MYKHITAEKIITRNAHIWCSENGTNLCYDVTIYLRNDREGIVLGYETTDWEEELLGYFVGKRTGAGVPIIEVHGTTMGSFRREIDCAPSNLEAYLECVRRARASMELVQCELSELTLGTVFTEDRLKQVA